MRTYEDIARILEQLASPIEADQLEVEWLEPGRLAVGRDNRERHAVILPGPPLEPTDFAVASAIRPGEWSTTTGVIKGTLLQLPRGDAFRTATATIAAELFRRGIASRPTVEVFAEVESFVALVLRRVLLPDDFVLGLVGELLVLKELLVALGESRAKIYDPTAVWHGWRQQARDFVLGAASIEVKTTGLNVSRHTISGFEQVEPRTLDGETTESLFVASVGLRRASVSGPLSIAGLADQIIELLRGTVNPAESEKKFVDRLAQYGPEGFQGYKHPDMRDQETYAQSFTTTFVPRVYDMADENIRIVRRADLARDFPFVLPHGVHYTMELPSSIPGSIENPRTDLQASLRWMAVRLWT
jgi:hypothetical protein